MDHDPRSLSEEAPRSPGLDADPAPPAGPDLVFSPGYVAGTSEAMRRVHREIAAVADSPVPVMLIGETGVGKERLARVIHDSSDRASGPFVAINCAAIPADLMEAELFGIEEGTATGVRRRRGQFLEAEGGTLLLDEIGEMDPRLQAKLLRVVEEAVVRPVGGRPEPIDARLISATNVDVDRRRREGRFRDDLYYRLAGFTLRVPPLRERREELPELIEALVTRFAAEARKEIAGIGAETLRLLVACPWPGNVRQLEHELRRLVYLAPAGGELDAGDLSPHAVVPDPGAWADAAAASAAPFDLDLAAHVGRLERALIRIALARTGGRIAPAARLLGLSRNGLREKIRRLEMKL